LPVNNYLAILADIKAKLAAVPNVGQVHDYNRLAVDWAAYVARFKDPASGRIKGFEITRTGVTEHLRGAWYRHHRFVLRGFLGFQDADATDKIFQPLIEEVCNAFRNAAPGDAWQYRNGDAPEESCVQVPTIDERVMGTVLCHYCEIHLSVTERINP
jgi:hypothetical protein